MQQMIPEFKTLSLADVLGNVQGLKAGQMKLDAAQREQEAAQKIRDLYASGQDMATPESQRQLMAISPEYGLKMADLQQRLRKSRAEISEDDLKFYQGAANGIVSQYEQGEKTPERLQQITNAYADMMEGVDPERARKLRAAPPNLDALYAVARSAAKYGSGGDEYFAPIQDEAGNYYQPSKAGGTPLPLGMKGPVHYNILSSDAGMFRAANNRDTPAQPLTAAPSGADDGASPQPLRPPAQAGWEWRNGKQAPIPGGPADKTAERQESLRKELQGLKPFTNYTELVPISSAVHAAAGRDTQAADLDIIYGIAKAMDPGSVVRESETQMAINTGSPAQKMLGLWNSVLGGARLTPEVRKNLLQEFDDRVRGHEALYKNIRADYDNKARLQGFKPEDVYTNLEGQQAPVSSDWRTNPEALTVKADLKAHRITPAQARAKLEALRNNAGAAQ